MKNIFLFILAAFHIAAFASEQEMPLEVRAVRIGVINEYINQPKTFTKESPRTHKQISLIGQGGANLMIAFELPKEFKNKKLWDIEVTVVSQTQDGVLVTNNVKFNDKDIYDGRERFTMNTNMKTFKGGGDWTATFTLNVIYLGKDSITPYLDIQMNAFPQPGDNSVVIDGVIVDMDNYTIHGKDVKSDGKGNFDVNVRTTTTNYYIDSLEKEIINLRRADKEKGFVPKTITNPNNKPTSV